MLKYIVTVTEDAMIAAPLLVLIYALSVLTCKKGRVIQWTGLLVSILASIAMAIVKNTTNKILTTQWNQVIFYLTILSSALYIILMLLFLRKPMTETKGAYLGTVIGAILSALLLFYELPDILAYPFKFDTGGEGIISVAWLVRFLGWAFALILVAVYIRFLYRSTLSFQHPALHRLILIVTLLINDVRCFGQVLRPWITNAKWFRQQTHRMFPVYSKKEFPWAFPFASFVHNNTQMFIFLIAGLALLIPVILFIENIRIHGKWNNPAQLRRLKADNRHHRRWACIVAVCTIIAAINLSVLRAIDNKVLELSPPEEYTISEDGIIRIAVDEVNDGHLHRFEYVTENNIAVRWIIVKKPGTAAFGVGLDACDVCGNAGYYERGEQIICKRCDVVMNINTIGFKGGCNPIPLESTIENGYVLIPLDRIIAAEKEFK